MADDLALTAARFGAALRDAGVPADPGRCERFARALAVARPDRPRGVYLCALATLIAKREHIETLQRVFATTFGGLGEPPGEQAEDQAAGTRAAPRGDALSAMTRLAQAHPGRLPSGGPSPSETATGDEVVGHSAMTAAADADEEAAPDGDGVTARRALASAAERLAGTDFAELSPAELLLLSGLMRKLTLAVPLRRSRRPRRTLHGGRTDLRATLRQARRTGGYPLRLAGRAPLLEPRRLVVLCDISGSMEPYARAMLQLLYCAAGGAQAEVFTFATRLTRLTGTLVHARPELALRRAGEAAPDWLGGTRIGEAIAEFNEHYGRRGMARGAVVVIISDGWDTGDPAVLGKAMERLSRVAHRIIWVNPRTQNPEYQPLAGGMAAAWPYCDAVVSAHSLHALDDLTAALAQPGHRRGSSRGAIRMHSWQQLTSHR
jgi:hypothetical protein